MKKDLPFLVMLSILVVAGLAFLILGSLPTGASNLDSGWTRIGVGPGFNPGTSATADPFPVFAEASR